MPAPDQSFLLNKIAIRVPFREYPEHSNKMPVTRASLFHPAITGSKRKHNERRKDMETPPEHFGGCYADQIVLPACTLSIEPELTAQGPGQNLMEANMNCRGLEAVKCGQAAPHL
ncbi:MAG: hypothetical protein CMN76_17815 [Spirochaetaceae bacterium]|nr:hypothetical protein [Spirochaetaceae bacterium]